MSSDASFAQEIQNIAQEIQQESQNNIQMTASSYDQSKLNQVGKITANTVNF